MKKYISFILLFLLFLLFLPFCLASKKDKWAEAKVINVIEGDTLEVVIGDENKPEKVRLMSIAIPEKYKRKKLDKKTIQERRKVVSEYIEKLVKNRKVYLEFDAKKKDRSGNLLAYVHIPIKIATRAGKTKDKGGKDFEFEILLNELLISEGYAGLSRSFRRTKYKRPFLKAQREAKKAKRGFWADKEKTGSVSLGNLFTSYISSKNSKIFHKPDCKRVKRIRKRNIIEFKTEKEAKMSGRKACRTCFRSF
jgi:micrococcal nuclease